MLITHIYEVFPLLCSDCGGQMRLIAFLTHSADIRQTLDLIGMGSQPQHIAPSRGPPLQDVGNAQIGEGAAFERDGTLQRFTHPTTVSLSGSIGNWVRRRF